jgi:transposase
MVPLPENRDPASTIAEAMALYEIAAKQHNDLITEVIRLKNQVEWFQRNKFGTRSEKLHIPPEETANLPVKGDPVLKVKASKRTATPKGHGCDLLPKDLETVEIHVPFSKEQLARIADGSAEHIRDEITERLAIHPPRLYKKRFIRPVVVVKETDGSRIMVTAPLPEMAVENGRADLSILIYLAVSKFVDHMPIDRIRKMFLRQGFKLSNSTMGDWVESLHDILLPVYLAMADAVRKCDLVHTDDTVVRVVRSDKAGKTHKGRMWVYIGDGHCVFEYSPTRSGYNPTRFLVGFKGKLQADGYAGYNAIAKRDSVVRVGCHAHARRYFEKALDHFPEALEMLQWYQELFHIEQLATDKNATHLRRLRMRRLHSSPIIKKMKAWLDLKNQTRILQSGTLGQAIGYALGQWNTLEEFLKDGKIPLSNNISERAMRGVVMGRNNYLFFGSETAAQRGAVLYSILHSCNCLGINPEEYLNDIVPRMYTVKNKDILDLTPAGWLANRESLS